MKTTFLKFALIVLVSGFSYNLQAQNNLMFEINSSAIYNDAPTSNYSIIIYADGKRKDSLFVKKNKAINLSLESDKVYSLVFKKENCPDRFVIVNTNIPSGIGEIQNEEPFDLQIEVSPDAKSVRQEYDDYPVAILMVNKKKKLLMASENYHKETHINQH